MKRLLQYALILLSIGPCSPLLSNPNKELPIVILSASYNNSNWYIKNLDSIRMQTYTNFRVIYIDDCSTDGTGESVQQYITKYGLESRITLIRNSLNKGALANQYHAIHGCKDDEIIIIVDGDDWLAHPNVLRHINQAYTDHNVWLTYGQFQSYPELKAGFCKATPKSYVETNTCRYYAEGFSHLRTFYAGLFKKVEIDDLKYKEAFYSVNADMAAMLPMVEMAGEHILFIPDVLYVYNRSNPLSDYKVHGETLGKTSAYIRAKQPYKPIQHYSE